MQSTQARNKGCVRSLHMLCDVLHENATTSGARYGLQTVQTCVPISSGPLFMFLSANLLWSAQKSRTFDPFDSKAPRWLPIFSPFGLPMTLAKSRAATNCIPFRPHAEPWRHISWNSMKLHVSTEKRLVYRVYPRLFRVPMCSIPGPCHTTSESSSQSMGKHCSHSCRSGPAKRRSGEAEKEMTNIDKFHRTNVRNSLDFRLIQTSSEFWILESEKRGVAFGEQHFLQRRSAPWQDLKAWQTGTATYSNYKHKEFVWSSCSNLIEEFRFCQQTNDQNTHRLWTSHQSFFESCFFAQRLSSQLDLWVVNNSRPWLWRDNATPVPKASEFYPS